MRSQTSTGTFCLLFVYNNNYYYNHLNAKVKSVKFISIKVFLFTNFALLKSSFILNIMRLKTFRKTKNYEMYNFFMCALTDIN